MDPAAFTKINQAVLLATLRGFAEHGFSGDIEFRLEGRQILRTVCENHVADPPQPSEEATQSVERNRWQLEKWAEGSETLLQVMFQRGKITKVRSMDRNEQRELRKQIYTQIAAAPDVVLTRRENEIFSMLQKNPSLYNKEIASALNISERTVKFHISRLLAKFGVRNRQELATAADCISK